MNLSRDKNKMSQDLKFSQAYEMEEKRWNSQMSMLSSSRPSLHSTYTVHSSYVLPILGETPDPLRRPPDYLGFALCSLFCNPVFGLFAILLSEKSKAYYHHCNYKKASRYGSLAYGVAAGGIGCTVIVFFLAISIYLWKYMPYIE